MIAGERRVRAAHLAGIKEIPAIIQMNDEDDLEIAITENVHRSDLTLTELAQATVRLRERGYTSRKAIATKLAITDKRAKLLLELTELPGNVQERITAGTINPANVETLAKINKVAPHVCRRLGETMSENGGTIQRATLLRINPTQYDADAKETRYLFPDEIIPVVERGDRLTIEANSEILTEETLGRLHKLVDSPKQLFVNVTEDDIDVARALGVLVEVEEFCGYFDAEVMAQMVNDAVGSQLDRIEADAAKTDEQRQAEADALAEKREKAEQKIREELDKELASNTEEDEYEIESRVVSEVSKEFDLDSEDEHVAIVTDDYFATKSPELSEEEQEKVKAERKIEREQAAKDKAAAQEYNDALGKQVFDKLAEVKPTPDIVRVLVAHALDNDGVEYWLGGSVTSIPRPGP